MAVISYKCPNCDGQLVFDPASQQYKCEYCLSLFSQQQLLAMNSENQEQTQQAEHTADEDAVLYTCPSCGAEIVTDDTTAATFCYYCHNPVVLSGRLEGRYLPDMVIPFEISKENAVSAFLEYMKKKKFAPRAFWNKRQIESITGVYFPYWIYDVQMRGSMQGEARNVRVWRTGNIEHRETKYYSVFREGDITLKNLTENALQKANCVLTQGIMPYQFEKMKPFQTGYLSGFLAERRDIEKNQVEQNMRRIMSESAADLMRDTVQGYQSFTVRNSSFIPQKEKWRYVLFPIWTITYKGRNDKIYYYSMNAQTGKVCGMLPVSYGKAALVSLFLSVIVFALGLLGGYFLW